MITIQEAKSEKELLDFIKFPFSLYKNNKYWVPSFIKDELKSFDKKNPIFESVDAQYFIAYKDGKIVGRIAAIINWTEVKELGKPKIRFGWFDVIDDIEVTKALIDTVVSIGKANQLEYIEGPMGFSNMDKAGMLTEGFEEIATMIGIYNFAYYPEHLKTLGFEKEAGWYEYKIDFANIIIDNVIPISLLIEKRYKVKALNFKSTKEILPYVDEMFGLLNKSYAELQSFVPIQQFQIDHYKEKYISFIHPDFISCVVNEEGKLVAFGITMPSFSRAFQKANGKLFPFGFIHLLRAMKKNEYAEFYLIGVDPEYQNKGVTALIFREMHKVFDKRGIKYIETNPQLEENQKIRLLWKNFDPVRHKRRMTVKRDL
ncbi:GNAT family N-acetyltransferase [Flavobacterium sp. '19STA2R22 D10 B1']|uniref:GNAT family N-acetyltransferase n=1 Tax=Flavobacterium aerium TaxID=3037261 RepID=UPI00278C3D92|nr:GNAT family N-acetyltransferase [Flavobacterium sp. '19STA2R22 D10 B1']